MQGKGWETGPTVYRPYPRRLESLTVGRCLYKGSTLSSVIIKNVIRNPEPEKCLLVALESETQH